ncbi:MAG: hypothetical protein Sapg2KO_07320 [Saprospiraceae bacterium]
MRLKITYLLFVLLIWQLPGQAQAPKKVLPKSFSPENAILLKETKAITLRQPNLEVIQAEDRNSPNNRFAYPVKVDLAWENGDWSELDNGDRIWRLTLKSDQALGLAVFFDQFYLPEGSRLHLYTPDRKTLLGAYTAKDNVSNDKFWIGFTRGNTAVLEYFEPQQARNQGRLHIFRVDYAYQKDNFSAALRSASAMELGFGAADACNDNINCPEGQAFQTEKKAVCRILLVVEEGTGYCTGSLINNVREDQTPYILSAFHCQDGFTPLFDFWRFDFNFEGTSCDDPATEPSFQSLLGCVQRAGRQQSDFLLLELNELIPASFDAYFLGWNRSTSLPTAGTMIHHARGDVKKISSTDQSISVFNRSIQWNNEVVTPPLFHFDVSLTQGTFEVGSSGGALLDQDNRIVGQLHGGNSDCETSQAWYGRLAISWDNGDTPETRLKDWLDPDNTGAFSIDGKEHVSLNEPAMVFGLVSNDEGEPLPNVQVQLIGQKGGQFVATTDDQGLYTLDDVEVGDIYLVVPTKTDESNNGLSVLDLIQIRKHILNLEALQTPFQMLAADVNASNSISTIDLILIQKVILKVDDGFTEVDPWLFLPSDIQFVDDQDPFKGITGASLLINLEVDPNGPISYDITGIKFGDVNNSVTLKP